MAYEWPPIQAESSPLLIAPVRDTRVHRGTAPQAGPVTMLHQEQGIGGAWAAPAPGTSLGTGTGRGLARTWSHKWAQLGGVAPWGARAEPRCSLAGAGADRAPGVTWRLGPRHGGGAPGVWAGTGRALTGP